MVKFELDDGSSDKKEPKDSKKVLDQLKDIPKTNMDHTRICPECGEMKVIVELVEMCIDCVNNTAENTIKTKKKGFKEVKSEDVKQKDEDSSDYETPLEIYKKQYPKKKPIYQRGGKDVESKHYQAWKKENEDQLTTAEDIKVLMEADEKQETISRDMVLFLDNFCIHGETAKKYKGAIKSGKGINTEFLKWYLENAKKDHLKHIDYKKMNVKNQIIVKDILDIKDDKEEPDEKKTTKKKGTTILETITKKSSKTLDKIDDHRGKIIKDFVSGLRADGTEFDFSILKDMTVQTFKDNLHQIPAKELQMCFYMVLSNVEFLYILMSNKMDFKPEHIPLPDDQIKAIKIIKNFLGK